MDITPVVEFTNVKCTSVDQNFSDFEYCRLKSVNRTYKYLSLKVKLYKIPVTKVTVKIQLLKRLNGYKPFLYNITVDACKFLKSQKINPVFGYFHGIFRDHSNMNHTCPYDHDIIVDKLTADIVNTQFTKVLPFPEGKYLFHSKWLAYGILRAEVDVYITLS
ncbi:uncharacterized protein LOC108086787 [Drosophila ficusphila]|uniref:uncharacterized protein LOC108086787 n=1 Tax=Drosophila ficusphila TaxID=30025 RepID=UPI0007E61D59|nr:uncharacterized protein LOC108086787 [Drosophila ficusphila]